MNSRLFSKMKIFLCLTLLILLLVPISKILADDRNKFTDNDLIRYQYGNGEIESNVAEKNITNDTKEDTYNECESNCKSAEILWNSYVEATKKETLEDDLPPN